MKNFLLIILLLATTSCYEMFDKMGCGSPSDRDKADAKWFYQNATLKEVIPSIIFNYTFKLHLFGLKFK